MFKISVFAIFLFIFVQCHEEEDNENNIFIPSKEWKIVQKGQKIPKGLHVRINLATGQTEAKLLDDEPQDNTKALSALPEERKNEEESIIPRTVLEKAVKNIKGDDIINPVKLKEEKDKFRSYKEIKDSLDELNIAPKLDAEIITELLEKHNKVTNRQSDFLKILEDLEFLAHQYDNALEFVRQNGFKKIIYKNLNSTSMNIKKETLKLMTALMQNNVKPKIHALETGSIGVLLRLVNLDPDYDVKSRALTALSALLRSFPMAQKNLIENGGLPILFKFYESDNIKFQVKLSTMISDLLVEHELSVKDEKLSQYYSSINLVKYVLQEEWCEKLNTLLLGLLITDKEDHDSIEKCLTAMYSIKEHCGTKFDKDLLTNLKQHYQVLSNNQNESDVNFFTNLQELCDNLLHYVHYTVKTEL